MYHPVSQKGAGALVVPPVLFGQNTTQPESEMYCWRLLLQIQASMQSQGTARLQPTRAVTFIVPFKWWGPSTESAARMQLMKGRPAPPPCSSTEAAGATPGASPVMGGGGGSGGCFGEAALAGTARTMPKAATSETTTRQRPLAPTASYHPP